MPGRPLTILAIDPGTKEIGFALFSGAQLEYYGVKTFKRRSPAHAFLAEVSNKCVIGLINRYRPEALAIEQTFLVQKNSALLQVTAAEIKHTARRRGLSVYEYAPVEVRNAVCGREKATKREMAQVIARRFPELARVLRQPTKWEERYWMHMYDAVALGVVCLTELGQAALGGADQEKFEPGVN